jgi:hypothetical protein
MRDYIDIINEFIWCGDRNMGVGSNITFGNYGKPHPDCRPSMGAMHDTQKMMHQNWEMELDDDEYEKLEQENELEDYRQDSRLIDRYARALNDQEFNMQEHIDYINIANDIITEVEITQAELDDPNLSPEARERLINLIQTQLGHDCFSDYCDKDNADTLGQGWDMFKDGKPHTHRK